MDTSRKSQIAHEAAKILLDTQSVLFNAEEPFTYTSGKKGPVYTDCRKLISFAEERDALMGFAVEMLSEEIGLENLDYIAGGETAGIPYAAFISQLTHKPMLYVRKKPKGFGRMAQIEGYIPANEQRQVILIEDLQNRGGSISKFVEVIREAGAIINHAFVVFNYGISPESEQVMKDLGVTLHALTTWWDVLDVAKEQNYFDAKTIDAFEKFLNAPQDWAA
jgi:orotate phosphoribosyltransferase